MPARVGPMRRVEQSVGKGSKLYVQPAELAHKLVKEMEDHKVSRPTHVSVRNRYTIFLCPEDYDRLADQKDELIAKFERHLAKHVRTKRYDVPGEISVDMVVDVDLKLGHFGILAERNAPGFSEQDLPARSRKDASASAERVASARPPRGAPIATGRATSPGTPDAAPPRVKRVTSAPEERARSTASETDSGATKIIPAEDAAELGLARQTIVVKAGNRVHEFTQGRVVIGRARDADFQIDNPDVSRRHAALFWSNGAVVLEDLGSTNGTMVNGYPVSSTVVGCDDVVVIGDCRMTVESR